MTTGQPNCHDVASSRHWHKVTEQFVAREPNHVGSFASARRSLCVSGTMIDARQRALRRLVLVMDIVSIALSMLLAALVHASLRSHFEIFKGPLPVEQSLLLAWVTMPIMLGLVVLTGLHRQFERPVPAAAAGLGSAAPSCGRSGRDRAAGIPDSDSAQSQCGRSIPPVYVRADARLARGAARVAPARLTPRVLGRAHLLLVGNDPSLGVDRRLRGGRGAARP